MSEEKVENKYSLDVDKLFASLTEAKNLLWDIRLMLQACPFVWHEYLRIGEIIGYLGEIQDSCDKKIEEN